MQVEVTEQGRAKRAVTWAGQGWVLVELVMEAGRDGVWGR